MNFPIEQQAALALLQNKIGAAPAVFDFSVLSPEEWQAVRIECEAQAISLMCFDAAESTGRLPPEVSGEWFTRSAVSLGNNLEVLQTQEWLTTLLDQHQIPYTILKGFSSAHYYPEPENRTTGDIDFLIADGYVERTGELLAVAGCRTEAEHLDDNHHTFFRGKVCLELHHNVAGIPEGNSGTVFREYFADIIPRSVTDDGGFRRPADPQHGVVILLHTLHHVLSGGIGLRHVCDWACFISRTHTAPFWREELIPLFKRGGLWKFACIKTDACVRYLGCPRPDWLETPPETVSDAFIAEILRGGNFGRKEERMDGTGMMVTRNSEKQTTGSKLKAMLRALNKTNHQQYPILNKAPWLYPFIMLWRILRYLVLMLCGKRQSLTEASRYADQRSSLFEQLELYQSNEE